jgi:hemerythrin
MGFTWRASYSVGNSAIDSEHKELFELAHAFFEADDGLKKTDCATRLFQYTRNHFDHEERLMQALEYSGLDAHVEQHNQLIEKLRVVAEKVDQGTIARTELKAFLSAWLLGHIVTFDAQLSSYVKRSDGIDCSNLPLGNSTT